MKKSHDLKITISKDGPYLVTGGVPLARQKVVVNGEGESLDWAEGEHFPDSTNYALCRCGHSQSAPFCDGSHKRVGFDGSETASRAPYAEQANAIDGPTMTLYDAEKLCAFGRFCDPQGQIWSLVTKSDHAHARQQTAHEAACCHSGRLVVVDKQTGQPIEPTLPPSVGVVHDTERKEDGPLWVRGGIPVTGADGHTYEVRNRMTLCRCGASSNKPFCDGSHASIGFHEKTK